MRHPMILSLCLAVAVSACQKSSENPVDETLKDLNVIDESNLSDIMLTVANPDEAVTYFRKSSNDNPDRIDLARGLAVSLVRARKYDEAVGAWRKVVAYGTSTNDDRVEFADALIRSGDWDGAEEELDRVPPTVETFKRYRLEAMVADSNQEWKRADSFYETAVGLTTEPSSVLNNWGFSKLSRGDFGASERMFNSALSYDSTLFTAKNNLVLARGAQRKYDLPVVDMNQTERAQLLHTLALSAIKQGDIETGQALLQDAIDSHPQHFEAAVRSLRALENYKAG